MRQANFNPPLRAKASGRDIYIWAVDGDDYLTTQEDSFGYRHRPEWQGRWDIELIPEENNARQESQRTEEGRPAV